MNQFELLDILTILSFIIGLQNLNLNIDQVNNLDQHLAQQDDILIKEQNVMLKEIVQILKKENTDA